MRNQKLKTTLLSTVALLAVAVAAASIGPVIAGQNNDEKVDNDAAVNPNSLKTKTPIKHLVVIFNENRSFDHYFGTYPNAMQSAEGETAFRARQEYAARHEQLLPSPTCSTTTRTTNPANGTGAAEPVPSRPHPGQHRRPEPWLYARAGGL